MNKKEYLKNIRNYTVQQYGRLKIYLVNTENLYLKLILTMIMIALFKIAFKLPDASNGIIGISGDVDTYNHGSVSIDGSVDVSGDIDTHERNWSW